jgi:CDP-diacylglycerol--glycerol-3-phosphate 3-phosphatidyltransferase
MRDVHIAIGLWAFALVVIVAYLLRAWRHGRARHDRTDADGGSVFLNKASMEMGYWLLEPVVDLLVALRITPNMVTISSLFPAFAAAVALAKGWFGLGALFATVAALADIVDGLLARRTGVASPAGEVVDAAVDRYGEFFFLGGLVIYYRTHWEMLTVILTAIVGSFMVSYTTAKAEALGVPPPRGSMRRAERAVYLTVGASLTPFAKVLFDGVPSHALRELPIIMALTVVGSVSNISAVQRFKAIAQALRVRALAPPSVHLPGDTIVARTDPAAGLVE